jgi:hypothetical protein
MVGVLYCGSSTEILDFLAHNIPPPNAIFFDTTAKTLRRYNPAIGTLETLDVNHGSLAFKDADDHTQYSLANGTRPFTGEVGGVWPITTEGLATKGYVDSAASKFKFLTHPSNLIEWTTPHDWTDYGISAHTGTDEASAAYLVMELRLDSSQSNEIAVMRGVVRKKGSSETAILPRVCGTATKHEGVLFTACVSCSAIVPCAEEVFQTKLQTDWGAPTNILFRVDLIGYIT